MAKLTHLDETGAAKMVDVSEKRETTRTARAEGAVVMHPDTLSAIIAGDTAKGDVLGVARIAGIMAAKRTHELIPLCHQLALNKIDIEIRADESLPGLRVEGIAKVSGRTGVEMEALLAVSITCLTIYDMAKAIDRGMRITDVRLVEKAGGRSGHWTAEDPQATA